MASVPDVELSELLDQIDQAALDGDVTRALLLCQKLAGHAGSDELRSWAERELGGYPSAGDVPEYRSVKCAMVGHGVAAMNRLVGHPIPPDLLPLEDGVRSFPEAEIRFSIAEVQQKSRSDESVTFIPERAAAMAHLVNAANQGSATFEQIHLTCSAASLVGVVTAVKSRLIGLTADLRENLPKGVALDDRKLSNVVRDASVVVIGDHNTIAAASDSAEATAHSRRWWQPLWVKVVGGCSLLVLGVVIEETWRRATIWPF